MLVQSVSIGNDYLTYDDAKHRYNLNGELVPGVTTVIHASMPEAYPLILWKIKQGSLYTANTLKEFNVPVSEISKKDIDKIVSSSTNAFKKETEKASDIGSIVHDYAESKTSGKEFDLSIIQEHPDRKKIENCLAEFEKYNKTTEDQLLSAEEVVGSAKHKFAGKYDLLTKRGNKTVLKDYKTSSGIYTGYFIQLSAYAMALEEWKGIKVDSLEILRFGKSKGDFEHKEVSTKRHIKELQDQFIRCTKTYHFIKEFKI